MSKWEEGRRALWRAELFCFGLGVVVLVFSWALNLDPIMQIAYMIVAPIFCSAALVIQSIRYAYEGLIEKIAAGEGKGCLKN